MRDFGFANFMSLTESKDFPNLNTQQVEEWISSSEIKVKEEEDVFQVIVKWMERNGGKKDERFFELFRHVRIVNLSRNFVFNVVLHHPLVTNSEECSSFLLDAMREASNGTEECYFAQPPNLVPRVRVTLDQRSGTRDSGIKRLPENKNPVIGQTAQASGIRTSGFTKCSHYSTRQLSFPWKN